jgi:hypothetical protein
MLKAGDIFYGKMSNLTITKIENNYVYYRIVYFEEERNLEEELPYERFKGWAQRVLSGGNSNYHRYESATIEEPEWE